MKEKECGTGWKTNLCRVTLSLAIITFCSGLAQAQDMNSKGMSGFYVGGLLGYADGEFTSDVAEEVDHEPSGALYGVQVGWSYPVGAVTLGIDGDFSFTSIDGEDSTTLLGYKSDVTHDVNYLSTIRGRVGFMAGPAMLYGTAGFAFADVDTEMVVTFQGMNVGRDEESITTTGWTAGIGVDFPIAQNFSLGAEYLYIDMDEEDVTMNIGGFPFSDKGDLNLNIIRMNVKYLF